MQDLNKIWVYRIISINNLEEDLRSGLYSKLNATEDPERTVIGNTDIISERDRRIVSCYPGTLVNNYVPFYFSVRTPMLFNIYTGRGVPKIPQSKIVYLAVRLCDIAKDDYQWCFTDGNAAKKITKYYTSLENINDLDWRSIESTDFKHDNADGDEDRIRKKHSEFLVRDYVPNDRISGIVVYNENAKIIVENLVQELGLEVTIVKNKAKYYF